MTTRDLRLGSGLVLFAYISAHLVNHALGLVSIDVAEAGLRVAVAVWHSLAGTALLYSAAAIHFAFALRALYEMRTLRMPALEAVRIAFGFGAPLLLIGHIATTRVGFELSVSAPTTIASSMSSGSRTARVDSSRFWRRAGCTVALV